MREGADPGGPELVPAGIVSVLRAMSACVAPHRGAVTRVGAVRLLPHQVRAVERLPAIIARFGGAMLCDAVGVGKTYVALAIAARYERCTIVAPAVLRDMWRSATAAAGVTATFVSVESLGRGCGARGVGDAPFVIVDEAHHLRNPSTRRYDAAARLCATGHTLLLSATPLHNRRRDLAALVALFAGVRAHAWSDDELARVVVRRGREDVGVRMPRVEMAPWRALTAGDDRVLDRILALPPPMPPRDGGDGGVLVTHALARQWASSHAALRGALRRRIARGEALAAALRDGRHPTRAELRSWVCADDAVQLAFTDLLVAAPADAGALEPILRRHLDALRELEGAVAADPAPDRERAAILREIHARHAPARMVAFTCHADTADAMYRALRSEMRVALLSSRGGMVAGGPLTRRETLERFAPGASGAGAVHESERIDVLIATDLLSEGVNLQDASVVVHLDLPWTAARLAQRVGRIARVGSGEVRVVSYALRPSERAESVVRTLRTLTGKARLAARVVGIEESTMLDDAGVESMPSPVEVAERVRTLLAGWAPPGQEGEPAAVCLVGAVPCRERVALAACEVDGAARLLVIDAETGACETPERALALLRAAERMAERIAGLPADRDTALEETSADMPRGEISRVLAKAGEWYDHHRAASDAGVDDLVAGGDGRLARARRRTIARLDGAVSGAGFARRGDAAERASMLRRVAAESPPIGLERVLYESGAIDAPVPLAQQRSADRAFRVAALLLFGPVR